MDTDAKEAVCCERCGAREYLKCSWSATSQMAPSITMHLCAQCEEIVRGIIVTILPKGPTHSADNNANLCEHCGKEFLEEEDLYLMMWFVGENGSGRTVILSLLCAHSASLVQCVLSVFVKKGTFSLIPEGILQAEAKRFPLPT